MQLALLERLAQGFAWTQHLLLAHEFVERARPHAVGERTQSVVGGCVAQQVGLRGTRARGHCAVPRLPTIQASNSGQRAMPSRPASNPADTPMKLAIRSRGSPLRPHCMEYCASSMAVPKIISSTKIFHQRRRGTRPV